MTAVGYEPPQQGEGELQRVNKLKGMLAGKLNSSTHGTFTLTENATSTTVPEALCSANSRVHVTPKTQTASEDFSSAGFWVEPGNAQIVIYHPSRAGTNRTFMYDVVG